MLRLPTSGFPQDVVYRRTFIKNIIYWTVYNNQPPMFLHLSFPLIIFEQLQYRTYNRLQVAQSIA
jgi:hypothetical protein